MKAVKQIIHRYTRISLVLRIFIGLGTVIMTACSSKDEPTPAENKPLIILDTDIGSSTDDL